MLTAKHVGARLKPLCGAGIPFSDAIMKLQEDIKSSRELVADSEVDQLLFDVVLGFHCNGNVGFNFSCVRDSYSYIRGKIGSMTESDVMASYSLLVGAPVLSFRRSNVLVGGDNIRAVVYVPPDHGSVTCLMKDWRKYMNALDGNSIAGVVAGVFRFLQIHPFPDGNGRMARLVFFALMAEHYGARVATYDIARKMFSSGGHRAISSSLEQIKHDDWGLVLKIFE